MRTVSAQGSCVRNALAEARRVLGVKYADAKEVERYDHEDGLYRSVLANGDVVEITVIRHARSEAHLVC